MIRLTTATVASLLPHADTSAGSRESAAGGRRAPGVARRPTGVTFIQLSCSEATFQSSALVLGRLRFGKSGGVNSVPLLLQPPYWSASVRLIVVDTAKPGVVEMEANSLPSNAT
jgi:hypothetical protein